MEIDYNKKCHIKHCFILYNMYSHLLDSYVLDYFTNGHWSCLPASWQKFLEGVCEQDLANLLDYDNKPLKCKVWPLSLIALKTSLIYLCLPRTQVNLNYKDTLSFAHDEKLLKLFWKKIKLKKRHEISLMAKICYKKAVESKCFYIVDIGSGLGHLSRLLSYGYGFRVCAIESQGQLCTQAREMDLTFEKLLARNKNVYNSYNKTVHVNKRIELDITLEVFLDTVYKAFDVKEDKEFKFGIVGLHPCGDLGVTLLRLFKECPNICFINMVGCCYMKLSTSFNGNQGFPLSRFCREIQLDFSYNSREAACHAIENYVMKLTEGKHWKLKIHAYRAIIETLIVSLRPDLVHCPLSNVKYSEDLTFEMYCRKAVSKLGLVLPESEIKSKEVEKYLTDWTKVVSYYSVRLLIAPLIETVILLDRLVYLEESGHMGEIIPLFDPILSPRNQIISCKK